MNRRNKIIISSIITVVTLCVICVYPIVAAAVSLLFGITFLIGLIVYEILNLLD